MNKRLYRSSSNKVLAGVCGGLGDYFDIDPTLLRLITVIATVASAGLGLPAYLLAWIIIPQALPGDVMYGSPEAVHRAQSGHDAQSGQAAQPIFPPRPQSSISDSKWRTYLPGLILVGLGTVLLANEYIWWFDWDDMWPIALVGLGLYLIMRNNKPSMPEDRPAGNGAPDDPPIDGNEAGDIEGESIR